MGLQCAKQKEKQPIKANEIKKSDSTPQTLSTTKEAIDFVESQSLANVMRTKPIKEYLTEQIAKNQIYVDSCDILAERIEGKSQLILRSYNNYTEKALKIKSKVLEYYRNEYTNYINSRNDTSENREFIIKETIQLLVETAIILNCLMDKNFDDENELWWTNDYYSDRIKALSLSPDTSENTDPITSPILQYLNALKSKIVKVIPLLPIQPKSIANSVAIANVHLTQFYKDLKLEFAKDVEEEVSC
ncbi:unnamed protein product (macronuclear) [Paramecium tetraurelia]|uniref:Uncharacterized protein n=1 Tax=Paramecium tetraurelia TaxID=5888 RepID=A0D9J5_PARTE|nr:uncharacterized protein GSPATT00014642001 [Paramecium tetraurelia]CAK79712.1 unnamed protein product [Paramecium tetraurelia]|eukprot:XP_001447109.1 hypothetical protein (macronuclear) [Paramecium tetraurelia strain d4-2]